jgi:hypothetical protein
MSKEIFTFPHSDFYGEVFAIVKTISGTYVCPGWHPVPEGTERDQIRFLPSDKPKRVELKNEQTIEKTWKVESSKPGKFYTVLFNGKSWSCNCPSAQFHRGDCKHVKMKKSEESLSV